MCPWHHFGSVVPDKSDHRVPAINPGTASESRAPTRQHAHLGLRSRPLCSELHLFRAVPSPTALPLHVSQDDSGTDAVDAGSSFSRRQRQINRGDKRDSRAGKGDHKLDAVTGLKSDDVAGSQTMTQKHVAVVGDKACGGMVIDCRSAPMTNAVDSGASAAWRSITWPSCHKDRSSDTVSIDLGAAAGVREVVDLRRRIVDLRITGRLALALGAAQAHT
jgi:hypothetical protein